MKRLLPILGLAFTLYAQDTIKDKTKIDVKDESGSYKEDSKVKAKKNGDYKEDTKVKASDETGSYKEKTKVRKHKDKTTVETEIKQKP